MTKIDDVSEAIGQLRSDVRDIAKNISKIEQHMEKQNGRLLRLEAFKYKLVGIAVALPIFMTILIFMLQEIIR